MAKLTRQVIIRQLLERESAGLPLNLRRPGGVEIAFYSAAKRIFGNWQNALLAAGIAPEKTRSRESWPPTRILSMIRMLARRRRPLQPVELKQHYPSLLGAARRQFGSWQNAILSAGVDPLKLQASPRWTREQIIEAVLIRALRNEPLRQKCVRPRSLANAAYRVFGSWAQALSAAGVDLNRHTETPCDASTSMGRRTVRKRPVSPYQTHVAVIDAIHARQRRDLSVKSVIVFREDLPLYRAAQRLFVCWGRALAAADDGSAVTCTPEFGAWHPACLRRREQLQP